jgi:hypothetical protein
MVKFSQPQHRQHIHEKAQSAATIIEDAIVIFRGHKFTGAHHNHWNREEGMVVVSDFHSL